MDLSMFRKQATAKLVSAETPGGLLTIAPPSTVTLFATLGLLSLALVSLAVFGRAEVVAEGRGIARPDAPPVVLHAPFSGVVLQTPKHTGELGRKGELLVVLDVHEAAARHDTCSVDVTNEQKELDQLEKRLAFWNDASRDHDASMALVLISQVRAQRDKVTGLKQRCDELGTTVARSMLTFPSDAVVADVAVSPGAEVTEGDALATLVPATARVVGYVALAERHRSELAVGESVRVKFDALPFDEVGAGTAHVTRLLEALPSGVTVDGDHATVFAEIAFDSMPPGAGPVRSGMTFTADVKTRRPRLLTLIFGGGSGDD
ncbi:MAG TPA: HlyD family efflux transporter periplasmic adaptor subunit [Polyangiaceae bacterium]|nr:HlyD family efflux transporter periplasmic adaptor subunit [Polyangiaceae bacterium]